MPMARMSRSTVRLAHGEALAQNRVGRFQLTVFLLQRLESLTLVAGHALANARVTLCSHCDPC